MKEKFRKFFAKHRHLVVISLIIAVILAALTPLLIPLGLSVEDQLKLLKPTFTIRAEDYESVSIYCYHYELGENTEQAAFHDNLSKTQLTGAEAARVCTILNDAEKVARPRAHRWEDNVVQFALQPVDGAANKLFLTLYQFEGTYYLDGSNDISKRLEPEAAQEILDLRLCTAFDLSDLPREHLCRAEAVTSACLRTKEERELSPETELSRAQIGQLCEFFQENLLQLTYKDQGNPASKDGWTLTLTMADGTAWQLEYQHIPCNHLALHFKVNSQADWTILARYPLHTEENPFAALPELLEETP